MASMVGEEEAVGKKHKKKAMQLLEEEEGADLGDACELKISDKFAKKYNAQKDKEELARASRILADEDEDDESSESEDEDAELLTNTVDTKIFDTLNKIRSRDPSIYDNDHVFFEDEDFKGVIVDKTIVKSAGMEKETRMHYKDFLRDTLTREGADALDKEEEALEKKKKTMSKVEEQTELRASLVAAAQCGEDVDFDDDAGELFTLKGKTKEELNHEGAEFEAFLARREKGEQKKNSEEILATGYWKADEELDENERFLRDYLLNKGWQETASLQASLGNGVDEKLDPDGEGDDDELDKADNFEKDYNFRFEVEEGKQIQGHARFPETSVRERNDKRKRQRVAQAERKEAEKIRRTEELKRLKNLKKQEIMRRLKQIEEVTGNDENALGKISIDEDFDPNKHDQEMANFLGDDYDNRDETLAADDLMKAPEGCEDLDVSGAAAEVLQRQQAGSSGTRRSNADEAAGKLEAGNEEATITAGGSSSSTGVVPAETDQDGEAMPAEDLDPDVWWLCDGCQAGIPAGKRRFDCKVCEDFTLCIKCFRVRRHPHPFIRRRVPDSSMPPEEAKGNGPNLLEQELLDEYCQMDYEDIIGGDLPTRFKYRKVEANNFGMSSKFILSKTDKELNRMMPLKKLRPYREPEDVKRKWVNLGKKEKTWEKRDKQQLSEETQAPPPDGKAKRKRKKEQAKPGLSAERLKAYSLGIASSGSLKKARNKEKNPKEERGGRFM